MSDRHPYIARADGWVAGQRVTAGERLLMTDAEARFEPVDPAPAEVVAPPGFAPVAAPVRRRRKGAT